MHQHKAGGCLTDVKIGTDHDATVWFNLDPCGIICAMVTWFLLMYACTVTVAATLVPWRCPTLSKWLNSVAFLTLGVLALVAHVRTMLTNPGAVPRDAVPLGTAAEEGNSETAALNRHDVEAGEEQPAYKKWCR
jgi:hypothetical protein